MERTRLLTIAVIGLLLLNVAMLGVIFFKKPPPPPHEQRPERGGPGELIIRTLDLDNAQREKFAVLRDQHRKNFARLNERMEDLHTELYALLKADAPDSLKANSLMQQISQSKHEIEQLHFNHFRDIRTLCRPEQKGKFDELVEEISEFFQRNAPPPGRR